jgi:splicing factor 3A subunit 1
VPEGCVFVAIIDKTASFVAKNGREFEERILENERNNPKFTFLALNDPYRPYYDTKVMDFKLGRDDAASGKDLKRETLGATVRTMASLQTLPKVEAVDVKGMVQGPPKEPPRLEFLLTLDPISSMDL